MFILYAVLVGVVAGVLLGGDAARLSEVRFHWKPVVLLGLVFQVVLFAPAVAERIGGLGPWLYVASTAAVLATVLRNVRIPGLPVVAIGALSNFAAIVANGGYMPASLDAMAALGKTVPPGYSNSALVTDPALQPLTDIFALPHWLPFANVYSIGDVLIGIGVAWAIVASMRSGRLAPAADGEALSLAWVLANRIRAVARRHHLLVTRKAGTHEPYAAWDSRRSVPPEGQQSLRWRSVQGKPVVRRGTQS